MKTLYESILSSTGTGKYRIGNRITEDGVPCTVVGELDGYIYLLSDLINIGTDGDFYDVYGLEKDDEKYKEILHIDDLFPIYRSKRAIEIYLFYKEVKEFFKKDLKRFNNWEIPSYEVLKKLNVYTHLNVKYNKIGATTKCWCLINDDVLSKTGDAQVFSFVNNDLSWSGDMKTAQQPLRLIKKIKK